MKTTDKRVFSGADVVASEGIKTDGKCGLLTNPTGVLKDLTPTIDMLQKECDLVSLFAAEHGIRGDIQASGEVTSYTDADSGINVYSLFGNDFTEAHKAIASLDTFIYDIQDVGSRFYTYAYTLTDTMEFCAKNNVKCIILDRPNMLGGIMVEGTILNREYSSLVGRFPVPTRYALTIGEFASMMNDIENIGCDLSVVKMQGWERDMYYDETGLQFIPPSPNIPTLDTAIIYNGTCIFEGTNLSEGRGTTKPFEMIGSPWFEPKTIIEYVGNIEGAILRECSFTPTFSKYKDELCRGLQIHITDRNVFSPFALGLKIFDALRKTNKEFEYNPFVYNLLGTNEIDDDSFDLESFISIQQKKVIEWQETSKKWYLY